MPKLLKPGDLSSLLQPGMSVFVESASGEPSELINELIADQSACAGVTFISCQIPGLNRIDFAGLHEHARSTSLFVTPETIPSYRSGKVRLMPLAYRDMYRYLSSVSVDVALIQVTPAAKRGLFSLGTSVHFVPAILENAKTVIAEINDQLPLVGRSVELDEARLDYIFPATHALPILETGIASETTQKISEHVATLVRDGDHVQFGIGKVPGAILNALGSHRGLVCHGGLIGDPIMALHEAGVLDPTSPMRCTSVIGTKRLYDWVRGREDVHVHPVAYTHDVGILAELERFVAINSVLSVDLSGLANAETVGGSQVGGCGGLPNFVRGAQLSKEGRSILALPSTAAKGKVSRIVVSFDHDVPSVTRSDADYVVTEYGIADLKHKSLSERAEALIAIAAPHFRNQLFDDWERRRD